MTVHILKLCVGAGSIGDLREWVGRVAEPRPGGDVVRITTRSAPKRIDDVLDGGSLYWVIRGSLGARQRILGVEPFTDGGGVGRVHILLHTEVVAVRGRPCRPFQGWRYLAPDEAPADVGAGAEDLAMPAAMRRELMELCLL